MKTLMTVFIMLTVLLTTAFSLDSEKARLQISGGMTMPQESFLLAPPEFLQYGETFNSILSIREGSSSFSDFWKNGVNVGVGLLYNLNRFIDVQGNFTYNNFVFDQSHMKNVFAQGFAIIDLPFHPSLMDLNRGAVNIYSASVGLRASLPVSFIEPYVTGAVGYLWMKQDNIEISYYDDYGTANSQNAISFYDEIPARNANAVMGVGGVGLGVRLSNYVKPFVEADYVLAKTKDNDTIFTPLKFGFEFSF